jgi:hypothetical protein
MAAITSPDERTYFDVSAEKEFKIILSYGDLDEYL